MAKSKGKNGRGKTRSYGDLWSVVGDSGSPLKARIQATGELARALCDDDAVFDGMLGVLKDKSEPVALRLAVLAALQAASFSVLRFAPRRARYLAALRAICDDPDLELRQRVLGMLAREGDGRTQQRLIAGLRNPAKALLPPEKALQLLSYDVHADAYAVAREIVKDPPSPAAKREALRLLAADSSSAPLFEKILRDKREDADIRQVSASALHALAPAKLQAAARAIVLDEGDDEDVQATSLTALDHFGQRTELSADAQLQQGVGKLHGRSKSHALKKSASAFLDKYGQ